MVMRTFDDGVSVSEKGRGREGGREREREEREERGREIEERYVESRDRRVVI
jgi:hypothetical protein